MNNIFIGFVFALLDFNLDLGSVRIGLIPDFIGYILITKGLAEMSIHSNIFYRLKFSSQFMSVFSGILYCLDIFGISDNFPIISGFLGLIAISMLIYIAYNVISGIQEMEQRYAIDLYGRQLKSSWSVWMVFVILTYFFLVTILFAFLSIIALFISFIANICFLVALNRSKHAYYNLPNSDI